MRNFSYLGKRKKKKANVHLGKSGVYWNIFSIPKSKQEYTILNGIDLEVLGNINKNVYQRAYAIFVKRSLQGDYY